VSRYYVVLPDGQRYGPANVQLLNTWVMEGRVSPDTVVEDVLTGQRGLAGHIPGVGFGHSQAPAPAPQQFPLPPASGPGRTPYHGSYQQPYIDPLPLDYYDRARPATGGYTIASFAATAIAPCACSSPLGIALAGLGLVLAIAGRTRSEKGSGCAVAAAVAMLAFAGLYFALSRFVPIGG
jgi:hypothetical protein